MDFGLSSGSRRRSKAPASTGSPAAHPIRATRADDSARISFCIFIASSTINVVPASTRSPTATRTSITRPGICARTSADVTEDRMPAAARSRRGSANSTEMRRPRTHASRRPATARPVSWRPDGRRTLNLPSGSGAYSARVSPSSSPTTTFPSRRVSITSSIGTLPSRRQRNRRRRFTGPAPPGSQPCEAPRRVPPPSSASDDEAARMFGRRRE